ncbi:hypothetical protein BB559_005339 [Furculomyces boomerangus]|uniref:Uncharacterized protein n=1 Tax=Furculomyces boomerangus TaxID=61424 RepID=A0A2T9Y7C1_9FUNG|nr:hypothetical protein BB559_005679 [Furculomyces boomerangus]PVU88873.1 hypothetical protein BB559_005339 [Furculomyces boomerangus]
MESIKKISLLTILFTFYYLVAGICIDLNVKVGSIRGIDNVQVILKEDETTKISHSKNISNGDSENEIFEQNGYKLTIYHKEKKWKLNIPEHMPRKRDLNHENAYCLADKSYCWSEYKDYYCFYNYQ